MDYRNTQYCRTLDKIEQYKEVFQEVVMKEHPKTQNLYNRISDNSDTYKIKFAKLYNYKCSYCGSSFINFPIESIEIDHFICESSFTSAIEAGQITNLVPACRSCNRNKYDFFISGKYVNLLHPDKEGIATIFFRDEEYNIRIFKDFECDDVITAFYEKMCFQHQARRLDYLLLNLRGLSVQTKGSKIHDKIESAINKLLCKRNMMHCR